MDDTQSSGVESQNLCSERKRGAWISFPFIIGTVAGLTLGGAGVMGNLIVYLIREFNIKSISAAQIANVVNGTTFLFPFVGAIIADSFYGSFPVALVSSCLSLLGTVVLTLTATINSLRPPHHQCNDGQNLCNNKPPSSFQYTVLYIGIFLVAIGLGGTRFTTATLGANQFDKPEHQGVFFNWFFFIFYVASVFGSTGLVYIQEYVSWGLGFGICGVITLIGIVTFLLGCRFYRYDKPQGSPLLELARVLVATIRKWKCQLSSTTKDDYYNGHDGMVSLMLPTKRLRFFNRAALIKDGDLQSDGLIEKPWNLCTVEQVENFKTTIGIIPLWTSSIFLGTPIGILGSLSVLQVLAMDRHLGPHFQVPAGSMTVIILISTSIFLPLLDRVLYPAWHKVTGKSLSPLRRIGLGHVFNVLAMAVSALVESKRLKVAHGQRLQEGSNSIVDMSFLWLLPQLVLVGIGEAFHFPAQVAFYYQQLPPSLRTTSTAMISLLIAIAFYLSTALIDQVRRITHWLPDDINYGRVDNLYWTLVVLGVINFGYYILCSTLYKYQNV